MTWPPRFPLSSVRSAAAVLLLSASPLLADPLKPSFQSVTVGNGQVLLTWGHVSNEGYRVWRSDSPDEAAYAVVREVSAARRAYHDLPLENGRTYYYKISALKNGKETFSDPVEATPHLLPGNPDWDFHEGDYSQQGYIGIGLPGTWRPFAPDSIWNTPLDPDRARPDPDGEAVMQQIRSTSQKLVFSISQYTIPVHVVNSDNIPGMPVQSIHYNGNIFDAWDTDAWVDRHPPLLPEMWAEQNEDGHLVIVDPFKKLAWELSMFHWDADGQAKCSTYNVWDLTGSGTSTPFEARKWPSRGGRGAGFPVIAGLIRPEEIAVGEIRHAMIYGYSHNRLGDDGKKAFVHPAVRSDGRYQGRQYPYEGSLLRLPPHVGETDFDQWGLGEHARVVARALRDYGMYNGDNSGRFKVYAQLLSPTTRPPSGCGRSSSPVWPRTSRKSPSSSSRS